MTQRNGKGSGSPLVASLGEPLLRLGVPAGERWRSCDRADVHVGGAEVNVLAALSALGLATRMVSALPDSVLGDRALTSLRSAGVDTTYVTRPADGRMGLYFVEHAIPPRAPHVMYDRLGSAFSEMSDLPAGALDSVTLAVVSGITPALGRRPSQLTAGFVAAARQAGATVCVDVNFRRLLWSPEQAAAGLRPLLGTADIVVCAERDARQVFGVAGDPTQVADLLAADIAPTAALVAVTLDEPGVAIRSRTQSCVLPGRRVDALDRFGAGDAFTAGLLYGLATERPPAEAGMLGLQLSALARTVRGDLALFSRAELEATLGTESGVLVR